MSEHVSYRPLYDARKPRPKLISVGDEAEERANLVGGVTVTEKGLAVCEHKISGAVMRLAAVRVGDGSEAQHVPFEQDDSGRLVVGLPANKPSKLGFLRSAARHKTWG